MTVMQGRGGFPRVRNLSVLHTAGRYEPFRFISSYIQIKAVTNACKVYFTEADYDADVNYVTVSVGAADPPYEKWEGPVEANGIWLLGITGTSAVELVAYQRRG